ncbi:hypothetical protein DIX90_06985, partial [Streptococcus iniae]
TSGTLVIYELVALDLTTCVLIFFALYLNLASIISSTNRYHYNINYRLVALSDVERHKRQLVSCHQHLI